VGDPTCSDGLDNNCNGYTDDIDIGCRESQDWSAASAQASSLPPGGPTHRLSSEAAGPLAMALLPLGFVLLSHIIAQDPRKMDSPYPANVHFQRDAKDMLSHIDDYF
jgi:hypothetical protein